MGSMIGDAISNAINTFLSGLANEFLGHAMSMLTDFLLNFSDINQFINVESFLVYSRTLAGVLLVTAIVWEAFKAQTSDVFNSSNQSVSSLASKSVAAAVCIYLFPWFVINILMPLNEALVKVITEIGKNYTLEDGVVLSFQGLLNEGIVIILGLLVLSVGFVLLGIISAIRFIDIIISIIISPLIAVSIVGNLDGAINWAKDVFCIVFSQSILILLLQLLLKIMADNQNLTGILLSIGCMAVMLRGPQILRNYVYKTGTGGGVTAMASIVAMKSTVGSFKKS